MVHSPKSTLSGGIKASFSSVSSSVMTISSSLPSMDFQPETSEQGRAQNVDDNSSKADTSAGPCSIKTDTAAASGSAVHSVNLKSKLILDNRSDHNVDRRLFSKDDESSAGLDPYSRSIRGFMLDRAVNNGPIGINLNHGESSSLYVSSFGLIGKVGHNDLPTSSFKRDIPSIAVSNANFLYRYQKKAGHDFPFVTGPPEDASIISSVSHNIHGQKKKSIRSLHRQASSGEEESFIYHDVATTSGSPTPETASLINGGRRLQSPGRLNFNDAEYITCLGSQNIPSLSPSLTTDDTRQSSISHVRQVSRRIFSKEKKQIGLSESNSTAFYSKSSLFLPEYKGARTGSVLSPIIDYGSIEDSPSPENRSSCGGSELYFLEDSSGFSEDIEPQSGSPHNYKSAHYRKGLIIQTLKWLLKRLLYFCLTVIFLMMAIRLFIFKYCDNGLVEFTVDHLQSVLISNEVLLFDINAYAKNLNMQSMDIWKMDVDVLMRTRSRHFKDPTLVSSSTDEEITIFLGNSLAFTTPLKFKGLLSLATSGENDTLPVLTFRQFWNNLFHEHHIVRQSSSGQVKLQWPGKDFEYKGHPLTPDQWSKILNSRFGLIIKGSFRYRLPLLSSDQVVMVSHEETLNPELPEDIP